MMLSDVLRSLFRRPVTEQYPFEQRQPPTQLRGQLYYDPTKCTGCCLCQKDCPANALQLITLDRKAKQFVLQYHIDRCTYCAQCVQSCRFECLGMSAEAWELAATDKEVFTVHYGNEEDVSRFLADETEADAG